MAARRVRFDDRNMQLRLVGPASNS